MIRDNMVYLSDIIESIELIFKYLDTVSVPEFEGNSLLQDAVYRRFEIIGEASNRISSGFKEQYPDVEWMMMKAMRNKIAHDYFGIKSEVVLKTVAQNLPLLYTKLLNIQREYPQSDQ